MPPSGQKNLLAVLRNPFSEESYFDHLIFLCLKDFVCQQLYILYSCCHHTYLNYQVAQSSYRQKQLGDNSMHAQ